ncbi:urea ABC transporter permease subunit UrtB [Rariglobus hedericola]|uniref:Urea ABC transporter permease subunit UrtB n=2 Tax=Rariglobus hedericola TaxID=2597822 RepID=A0A556QLQ7_9BACT|nr:urea ABC transporter permease subunit UrtB [Rariglobus hedericola]
MLADNDARKIELITSLAGEVDESIKPLLIAWREDGLYLYEPSGATPVPVQLTGEKDADDARAAVRVDTGAPLVDAEGKPVHLVAGDLNAVEHTSMLRRAMKGVLDLIDIGSPDAKKRLQAIQTIGFAQETDKIPAFQKRLAIEENSKVRRALREAIAVTQLKDPSDAVKLAAVKELKELHSLSSYDLIRTAMREADAAKSTELATEAKAALVAIDNHKSNINFFGTLFRGLSLGSILLIVAIGLAITFGLMGVINMAHGEMIAIGAYTTYLVENIFGAGITIPFFGFSLAIPGMNTTGAFYQTYFLFALPLSFLTAAVVGIGLERSIIRFLYRRPLESLLATWGVSLLLQQGLKLMFGSNNVQVSSPSYLSGNWTVNDIIFGWNRVFVIGFAGLIVFGVWLILTKTPLGLLIRSVMQNRGMASCMGVRTERVNMLTFGLGSGLAGLAGAFISQIGNVGPSLGQNYIVDCFMTVVVGGVGNLAGTIYSALGIGLVDQSLQQILLNPVLGKILVLVAIILFLQWRPSGLFVTRSRNLDD